LSLKYQYQYQYQYHCTSTCIKYQYKYPVLQPWHTHTDPSDNDAVVDIRLRPQSGAAIWWVSYSIRYGEKSMLLPPE